VEAYDTFVVTVLHKTNTRLRPLAPTRLSEYSVGTVKF
jgi:hypothetical protein